VSSTRSQTVWASQTSGEKGRLQRGVPSDITGSHDPFGDLNRMLGYAIAVIAIAMLAHTFLPGIF
jgi:hypothetical protein